MTFTLAVALLVLTFIAISIFKYKSYGLWFRLLVGIEVSLVSYIVVKYFEIQIALQLEHTSDVPVQ
jgi:hypothetical protein